MLARIALILLTIQLSQITGRAQARLQIISLQQGEKKELSFPLIEPSTKSSKEAAQKVNDYLQLQVLTNETPISDPSKVFEKSRYIRNDSSPQYGYSGIKYDIEKNNSSVLSVTFSLENTGANTTYHEEHYNFDSKSGAPLTANQLFTSEGLAEIKNVLARERKRLVEKRMKEIKAEEVKVDYAEIATTFTECNKDLEEDNFSIRKNSIVFCKGNCFGYPNMSLETNFDIEMAYGEVEKYLSLYGMKILK